MHDSIPSSIKELAMFIISEDWPKWSPPDSCVTEDCGIQMGKGLQGSQSDRHYQGACWRYGTPEQKKFGVKNKNKTKNKEEEGEVGEGEKEKLIETISVDNLKLSCFLRFLCLFRF